jgi:flavorubredoxin
MRLLSGGDGMTTRISEIADGIFRLSTFVPQSAPPHGLTFNQFLLRAEQPLLFHLGHRRMFPEISAAVAKIIPLERLRWLTFSHTEADECGALGEWMAAVPGATAAHGAVGCNIWLRDAASRPPRVLADREVLDIGGKRVRRLDTPHLPHGWDAGLIYEETTGTLFCSDLFARTGDMTETVDGDILEPAIETEERTRAMSLTPNTPGMLRRLADLKPRTLGLMHGPAYSADTVGMLEALARHFDGQLRRALAA